MWKGNPELEQFLVPIEDLKRDKGNGRYHGPASTESKKEILRQVGQQSLITTKKLLILTGNGFYTAAVALGWTHFAAVETDLTDKGKVEFYKIADNRTAELSEWDRTNLSNSLTTLFTKHKEMFKSAKLLWSGEDLAKFSPMPEPQKKDEGHPNVKMAKSIRLTRDQRITVDRAVSKVRTDEGDDDIAEGRVIELICGDFLA